MAFIPVLNTVNVKFQGLLLLQQVEFNLNFFNDEDPDTTNMALFADNLATAALAGIVPQLSTSYTLLNIQVSDMSSNPGPEVDFPISVGNAGTDSSEVLPTQNAVVIKFGSGISGRSFKGRIYLPGMTINSVAGGVVLPDAGNNYTDTINTLCHAGEAEGWEHVIVSKFHNGAPRASGVVTGVTNYSYNPVIGIQRRRRIGSGY